MCCHSEFYDQGVYREVWIGASAVTPAPHGRLPGGPFTRATVTPFLPDLTGIELHVAWIIGTLALSIFHTNCVHSGSFSLLTACKVANVFRPSVLSLQRYTSAQSPGLHLTAPVSSWQIWSSKDSGFGFIRFSLSRIAIFVPPKPQTFTYLGDKKAWLGFSAPGAFWLSGDTR